MGTLRRGGASTSLHHVEDLDLVLDRIGTVLRPGGTVVVLEWAWERFDEATAEWCFARLGPADAVDDHDWLRHHHEAWCESGRSWQDCLEGWARDHGLHQGHAILEGLAARFDGRNLSEGPYLFPDLADISEAEEQDAIEQGLIKPTGLRYVGVGR